ncbi:hypothetical protein [Paracidovorax konjaci]|uniref:PsiF repeat-containing protein n=1 Tax=Paracidovorax konjaci TaxID=32040 RepID=A0A1I1RRR2_9BURK|nr:hypothetical protein [Paracidovorax konjaci]SFD37049.1 hypothetical protein SAMN04489710_101339 [Paracidovorax konjaci]
MQRTNHARTAAAILAVALLGAAAAATAATPANTAPADEKSAKAPPKPKRASTKVRNGPPNHSGETTAERDRRLYRECQGLPNAGACLGYTRR